MAFHVWTIAGASAASSVSSNALRWKDAPAVHGPHKTLYNRFRRWAEKGVFHRIFAELAGMHANDGTVILDSPHIKAHRTAASLLLKKGLPLPRSHAGRTEHETERGLRR